MKYTFSFLSGFRSASSWFELYATFSTFMMLLRTVINDVVPDKVRTYITTKLEEFFSYSPPDNMVSLTINQSWDERCGNNNQLYEAVFYYLPLRVTRTYKSLKIGKLDERKDLVFAVDAKEEVVDEFEGIKFKWVLDDGSKDEERVSNKREFKLSFHEKHREIVVKKYIPYILGTYETMESERRIIKLNSWSYHDWNGTDLSHPATFDSIALDPELKKSIIDDLERFLKRKEMYKKVGKPWKRGYLLYGPPGTGKSSLIAAMANYLKFDVYDLDLNSINSNSELMAAMRRTSRRSIIVLEDIDCNKEVNTRLNAPRVPYDTDSDELLGACLDDDFKVDDANVDDANVDDAKGDTFTLSGLLNCVDGLWSSHGEERITIFTTNHVEKIDPALLRPGRMDVHINLSYLKAKAFRVLASNYLDIQDHPLFEQIEDLLEKTEFTPAEVAEQLLRSEDPDIALDQLLKFLTKRA
ncbi:PREDICTED: AAA-ATPase At3g50940-like isoform X2 [Lupinus angustifolius]|uniref:AAA-ATPase At3g50940-like isoform X2 n=1 Tax=Lupinus angustifolius TaxID=3871 RepID=UPI00092F9AEB|nr:PREDICTED: AAA-ATPase At3g50940-like isoform X2 [Lupinus angustifolius]